MQNGKSAGAAARPMLFQPHTIRGLTLKNRTVLAPMIHYRAREGLCGPFHTVHLGKFALGGFGLVFTEATAVEPRGMITDSDLCIFNEAQASTTVTDDKIRIAVFIAPTGTFSRPCGQ